MAVKKYRLYIDESGTHHYCTSDDIKKKYLCLCGVIIANDVAKNILNPCFYDLKQFIATDKDEFPVLHREDIVGTKGCFKNLNKPEIEQEWNNKVLWIFENIDYAICGIVLDKKNHSMRYGRAAKHPYHYCLDVLLERYIFYLNSIGSYGDVVAESRGKKEDKTLSLAFDNFYKNGTWYVNGKSIRRCLSSKKIKIKPKGQGYWGLELADLLALVVKLDVLHTFDKIPSLEENFNLKIIEAIQSKYRKNSEGETVGFGKKLIE